MPGAVILFTKVKNWLEPTLTTEEVVTGPPMLVRLNPTVALDDARVSPLLSEVLVITATPPESILRLSVLVLAVMLPPISTILEPLNKPEPVVLMSPPALIERAPVPGLITPVATSELPLLIIVKPVPALDAKREVWLPANCELTIFTDWAALTCRLSVVVAALIDPV